MKFKEIVLGLCLLCIHFITFSQIGFVSSFHSENILDISEGNNSSYNETLTNYHIGIQYQFNFENYRIEFYPDLKYGFNVDPVEPLNANFQINQQFISAGVPIRFFVLDFEGDCNCPTFSKGSNFFSKGFFFEIRPGYQWVLSSSNQEETKSKSLKRFGGSLGAGLDVGLSESLTITVFGRKGIWSEHIYPDSFDENIEVLTSSTNFFELGISLSYYWPKYN
jgi:hypothetical protein